MTPATDGIPAADNPGAKGARVSILSVGDSIAFGNAKVDCERCEEAGGWTGADSGLHCPYGCGVRVVSTQAEDDERYRRESKAREEVSRARRAERRGLTGLARSLPPADRAGDGRA